MLNQEEFDDRSEQRLKTKKKLFWVTRYSLGKTQSKELLIEHEFSPDENRHRLIEIRNAAETKTTKDLWLAIIACIFNPLIGLVSLMFYSLSHRRSNEDSSNLNFKTKYALVSRLLSIISIGSSIGIMTSILFYFFFQSQ